MADDDLQTGRPRATTQQGPGNPKLGPSQAVTLLMSLMLVGMIVCAPMQSQGNVRMLRIDRPVETVQRVFERKLWIEKAIEKLPASFERLARMLVGDIEPVRERALVAFGEVLQQNGHPRQNLQGEFTPVDPELLDRLRARRVVLLFDAGRFAEAQPDLERLSAAGHSAFVAGLELAFARTGTVRSANAPVRTSAEFEPELAGDDWAGLLLRTRLESALGMPAAPDSATTTVAARLDLVSARVVQFAAMQLALLGAGLVLVLIWLARNRPELTPGSADIPPAWMFESGYATAVRVAFAAIAVQFVVTVVDAGVGRPMLAVGQSLMIGLPVLWLIRRRLLSSLALTFRSAFGIAPSSRPLAWIGIALALYAIQWVGARLFVDGLHAVGAASHWSERVDSVLLWHSRPVALFELFDACVVMPIVSEIAVRGLLFLTLRRNYGLWQSALFSSLLFSAAQFTPLPETASNAWTGFVLAIAYERTRNMVPNIATVMLASALLHAHQILFWR